MPPWKAVGFLTTEHVPIKHILVQWKIRQK